MSERQDGPGEGDRVGKYRLLRRLGRGGCGVVFEAVDTLLDRRVALRLLDPELAEEDRWQRLVREARAAAGLGHPNTAVVYEAERDGDRAYLAAELLPGGSVEDLLRQGGPPPWPEATRLAAQACRGLAAAHAAGLLHRAVKPSNLLRAADGTVKLADFGLVKPPGRPRPGEPAVMVGTPDYMSPEQYQGGAGDARSDVYSLGATYFALLTGKPPYALAGDYLLPLLYAQRGAPPPDPRVSAPDVPERCAAIVRRAMAADPADRYPSALALLVDLEAALAPAAPAVAATPAPSPAPPRRRWRRRLWLGALLSLVAGAALGVALAAWANWTSRQ